MTTGLRLDGYVYDTDFLHPVLLAREAAEIGVLSDGRMELGIGAGWPGANTRWPASHSTPGRPEPRFEEAVHIIRSLCNGAAVTHSDEFYELEECELSGSQGLSRTTGPLSHRPGFPSRVRGAPG